MIQCKRVYDVPDKEDGYRVLLTGSGRVALKRQICAMMNGRRS